MRRIHFKSTALTLTLVLFTFAASGSALAGTLPRLKGKPILTILGHISHTNKGKRAVFDRAGLESLGMEKVVTSTPWYKKGKMTFEGPSMRKLMKVVGAKGTKIFVTALNDYTTEIPLKDFKKYHVILAMKRNGKYMPISDKGPLFIIYPLDSSPELNSRKFHSRCAWQVMKIQVN